MRTNTSRRSSLRAARMLSLACTAGLGLHFNTPDDKQGGGGTDKPGDDKGKTATPEPEKLTLTKEELAAQVAAAVEAERKKHQADAEASRKRAEEEQAKKQGEFQKLYEGETARAKELEAALAATKLEARKQYVALKLQRHLNADHKDYAENDVDILPHVQFDADTPDEEVEKRIKAATDAFVKRTPKASALSGAPAGAVRGKIPAGTEVPPRNNDRQQPARPVGPAARF